MKKTLKVAVIILNWNGISFLKQFIPVLEKFTTFQNVELVVADNGSTDNSMQFLKENHKNIKLIEFTENHGFAEGYNKAISETEAEYVLLLNSDIEVTENWLMPLLNCITTNDLVAGCVPKIKSFHNKTFFEYAGAAGGYIDKLGYAFCKGRIFDSVEEDKNQYNRNDEVFWTSGAAMLVKRAIFLEAGGLDSRFFAHMEEIDLCWRIKNMGYKLLYCADSTVYHIGGGTLPKSNPRKTYLNFRNNLMMLLKNLPAGKIFSTLFVRMLLDGIAAISFLAKGKGGDFFAVLKAHFHFYKAVPYCLKKRKELKNKMKVSFHKEIYQRSIVVDYMIRKKKTFTELNFKQ